MISVVMPTYNRARIISKSILSVLNQTYTDIELIIIDDGSTDNTEKIVKLIDDSRIQYVKISNGGAAHARNYGISLASGQYIALIDSDDTWRSTKLEKVMECLNKYNADIVFSNLEIHGKRNSVFPNLNEGVIDIETLICKNKVAPPTLIAKKEVFEKVPFNNCLRCIEDYEWVIRASQKYSFVFCNEILVDVYQQKDSLNKYGRVSEAAYNILNIHGKYLEKYPEAKAIFLSKASIYCEKIYGSGYDYSYKAWQLEPSLKNFIILILSKFKLLNFFYLLRKKKIK